MSIKTRNSRLTQPSVHEKSEINDMKDYHLGSFMTDDNIHVNYVYTHEAIKYVRNNQIPEENDLFVKSAFTKNSIELDEGDFESEAIRDFQNKVEKGLYQ